MILIFLGKIPSDGPIYVIMDTVFKISLGFYIILFFGYHKSIDLNKHDRMLLVTSGFILLMTIPYKEAWNSVTGEAHRPKKTDTDVVHMVSKPCPPCKDAHKIQGTPIF